MSRFPRRLVCAALALVLVALLAGCGGAGAGPVASEAVTGIAGESTVGTGGVEEVLLPPEKLGLTAGAPLTDPQRSAPQQAGTPNCQSGQLTGGAVDEANGSWTVPDLGILSERAFTFETQEQAEAAMRDASRRASECRGIVDAGFIGGVEITEFGYPLSITAPAGTSAAAFATWRKISGEPPARVQLTWVALGRGTLVWTAQVTRIAGADSSFFDDIAPFASDGRALALAQSLVSVAAVMLPAGGSSAGVSPAPAPVTEQLPSLPGDGATAVMAAAIGTFSSLTSEARDRLARIAYPRYPESEHSCRWGTDPAGPDASGQPAALVIAETPLGWVWVRIEPRDPSSVASDDGQPPYDGREPRSSHPCRVAADGAVTVR